LASSSAWRCTARWTAWPWPAAVSADARGQAGASGGWVLFGLGAFLGVLLHKPLDALSVTSLMAAGGWPPRERRLVNLAFALMCPLGAAAFYLGHRPGRREPRHGRRLRPGILRGVFVCIALGDLLPELQFHAHDRVKLSLALLLGVAVAMSVWLLEPPHVHGNVGRSKVRSGAGCAHCVRQHRRISFRQSAAAGTID